jgi:hypothetical protein
MTTEIEWSDANSAAASLEGWDVFDVDGRGYFEIQKVDDLNVFESDEDAVEHVRRKAATSSEEYYRVALEIHDWFLAHQKRPAI